MNQKNLKNDKYNFINNNIPILKGLWHIIEKSGCNEILNEMYDGVFNTWCEEIVENIKNIRFNKKSKNMSKINNLQQVYMWKIGLIWFSLKDSEENIARFVVPENEKMRNNIIMIFNNTKPIDETYIYLLRIIQYSAEQRVEIANYYRK